MAATVQDRVAKLAKAGFKASEHQVAVFNWIANGEGNAFVDAVAGSGKSTTIMRGASFCPMVNDNGVLRRAKILYLVFSKDMQKAVLGRKDLPDNMECATTHSFGFTTLKGDGERYTVDQYKTSKQMSAETGQIPYNDYHQATAMAMEIISAAKAACMRPEDFTFDFVEQAVNDYCVENNFSSTWMANYIDNIRNVFTKGAEGTVIDFDDMIYLPVIRDEVVFPKYDWVMVDEAQDLNPCQIEFLKKLACQQPNTRFLFVGDPHQSIFAWRGADPEAVKKIVEEFDCETLPLSVTYRCPTAVVTEAQAFVPHLQARDNAPTGAVETIEHKDFADLVEPGDMVLCRCVAPLVTECLRFIRNRQKAVVLGRDIGTSLFTLYRNHVLPQFNGNNYEALIRGEAKALAKMVRPGQEMARDILSDRFAALGVLIPSATADEREVKDAIHSLFTDEREGLAFCSIHRAKGLEAKRVFLLRPDLLPFPKASSTAQLQQEHNLHYVAVTRALESFIYVTPPPKDRDA